MSHGPRRPLAPWSRRASSILPVWTPGTPCARLALPNTRSIPCSMAGGMGRRDARASLHERIHGAASQDPAASVLKHCWVTDRHGRLARSPAGVEAHRLRLAGARRQAGARGGQVDRRGGVAACRAPGAGLSAARRGSPFSRRGAVPRRTVISGRIEGACPTPARDPGPRSAGVTRGGRCSLRWSAALRGEDEPSRRSQDDPTAVVTRHAHRRPSRTPCRVNALRTRAERSAFACPGPSLRRPRLPRIVTRHG